jgi:hypothetical protein
MPNIKLIDSDESVIGSLRFTICHDGEELEVCHDFGNSLPSFEGGITDILEDWNTMIIAGCVRTAEASLRHGKVGDLEL